MYFLNFSPLELCTKFFSKKNYCLQKTYLQDKINFYSSKLKLFSLIMLLFLVFFSLMSCSFQYVFRTNTSNSAYLLSQMRKANNSTFREGCSVNISKGGLGEPQPLLIHPETSELLMPDNSNGILYFHPNETIELYCSKNFTTNITNGMYFRPQCLKDNIFKSSSRTFKFNEIICTKYTYHTARRTNRTCDGLSSDQINATIIEIGFYVKNKFHQLMEICYNESHGSTFYTHHKLNLNNLGFQKSFKRPGWLQMDFYKGLDIQKLYNQARNTFANILGSQQLADGLIGNPSKSLERGHLAAKVDFIFGLHQRATFYIINTAPQWSKFNSGNWVAVENAVRQLVARRNISIDVYTGTHDVLTHTDIHGESQKLYLHFDKSGKHRIPIPKLFYKFIYETKTQSGLVLIGVNHVQINLVQVLKEYIICPDISDKIPWITWKSKNTYLGYTYACEFNEFIKVVDHLPNLNVTAILI